MSTPANSLDITQAGLVKFDGTSNFTGVTVTQHSSLVGNTSNGITSLAVAATGTLLNGHTGADPSFDTQTVGNYTFTKSTAGSGTNFTVSQTDNSNGTSNAAIMAQTGGTSGGDSIVRIAQGTTQSYCWGIDHTDATNISARMKSGSNATTAPSSGDTTVWSMTKGGSRTLPAQPCIKVKLSGDVTNVTGDGTAYTVIFDSVITDQQSNYNNSTGIFTAPIAGMYLVTAGVTFTGLTALDTTGKVTLTGSDGSAVNEIGIGALLDPSNQASICLSYILNMSNSGTVKVVATVSGSTKSVGIKSGSSSWFCVCLLA